MKNRDLPMGMGGFGSGRHRHASTATVEQCRHLDVDEFTDAVEHPGRSATVRWGDPDDPDATIQATLLATLPGEGESHDTTQPPWADDRAAGVRLSYTVTDERAGESREHEYTVPFEYTECNFGGYRPWFRCPGVVDGVSCGDRVGKLYRPPGQDLFLCRECYDLGYRSSRDSGNELKRAEQRYRKAFAKADAEGRRPHPNNAPYSPERPKGMHSDTFEDLLDDVDAARREWSDTMERRTREMVDRYGGLLEETGV